MQCAQNQSWMFNWSLLRSPRKEALFLVSLTRKSEEEFIRSIALFCLSVSAPSASDTGIDCVPNTSHEETLYIVIMSFWRHQRGFLIM